MARQTLLDSVDHVKYLAFGESGTGKTTAVASLAKLGKVIVVDAESGLKGGALSRLGIPTENIEVETEIRFSTLHSMAMDLADDPGDVVGVVLDSATEIQKMLMEKILHESYEKSQRKGVDRDPFDIERGDWGKNTEVMRRLIRANRDIPAHVAFTCLVRRDTDSATGQLNIGPAMSPALQNDLIGYVDIIGYHERVLVGDTVQYIATFQGSSIYQTKDRYGVLPRWLINPSMDRIIAYVNGDLTAETDPEMQEAVEQRKAAKGK